mmetsp:Transcript_39836/g.81506  ORF Transcript_39836/g.81506 Transcript_39836/m.81506 type:complete len:208 (-) Transcript_39836:379-1002(-)
MWALCSAPSAQSSATTTGVHPTPVTVTGHAKRLKTASACATPTSTATTRTHATRCGAPAVMTAQGTRSSAAATVHAKATQRKPATGSARARPATEAMLAMSWAAHKARSVPSARRLRPPTACSCGWTAMEVVPATPTPANVCVTVASCRRTAFSRSAPKMLSTTRARATAPAMKPAAIATASNMSPPTRRLGWTTCHPTTPGLHAPL